MIRTDSSFALAIERAVKDAERGTSAELVVVVAARSGSYLDVALLAGSGAALAVLLVALFAPPLFPPWAVAIEVPLVLALATWLIHHLPAAVRALAPESRRRRQVERAAAWWFLEEAVHGTRDRTGVLVYVSLLEERVEIVPDLGLSAFVLAWDRAKSREDVLRGIAAIGALLKERLPARAGESNELADAPRIVP
jgi:putative membrane protein